MLKEGLHRVTEASGAEGRQDMKSGFDLGCHVSLKTLLSACLSVAVGWSSALGEKDTHATLAAKLINLIWQECNIYNSVAQVHAGRPLDSTVILILLVWLN